MKTKFTSVLFLLSLISHATTWTVDKTAGAGAQFIDISPAINNASAGDTILVHSAQLSYGTVHINKHVVLIGPGHYPAVSQLLPATVGTFIMDNGCDGTTIEGFRLGNIEGSVFQNANNITIRNNYFNSYAAIAGNYGDNSGGDNWLVEGNVFVDPAGCGGCNMIDIRNSASGNDNWTFRNNFIQIHPSSNSNHILANANSTTIFANNIIVYTNPIDLFISSSFAFFENNIFWVTSTQTNVAAGCVNCAFNNNLFYSPNGTLDVIPGVGNLFNQDPEFMELNGNVVDWSYQNDYHHMPGSPAIGSAADGDDMGIYGVDYNFRMEGFTNDIPRLTEVLPQYIVVPVNGSFSIEFGAVGAGQ